MAQKEVALSKTLSFVLRHGAVDLGLDVLEGGYVSIPALLRLPNFRNVTEEMIKRIVSTDQKQRYSLSPNGKHIRANQGHSFVVPDEDKLLRRIADWKEIPVCIHGTYSKHLSSIMEHGLSRMNRQHIHFAPSRTAKSGMRRNCDVQIFVDVERAMADGCPFYLSENGVILSPGFGDTGLIPSKYFQKVVG